MIELEKTAKLLKKISYIQLISLTLIGLIIYSLGLKDHSKSFIIVALGSFFFTQLLHISSKNNMLILFGFPIRVLAVGIPIAILVHKYNPNLLTLFFAFVLSQAIYFYFIWHNINADLKKNPIDPKKYKKIDWED